MKSVLLGVVAVASATKGCIGTEDGNKRPAVKASHSKFNTVEAAAVPPPDPALGAETMASIAVEKNWSNLS